MLGFPGCHFMARDHRQGRVFGFYGLLPLAAAGIALLGRGKLIWKNPMEDDIREIHSGSSDS
jgi:hypothetical protein